MSSTSSTFSDRTATGEDANCEKCSGVKHRHVSGYGGFSEPHCFTLHTERQILRGCSKDLKHQKKNLLEMIQKYVAALRNTKGGMILIHIEGQRPNDRYLGYFDEFISFSLGSLIQDGQLYTDAYSKNWLSDIPDYQNCHDFVMLCVEKGEGLTTVDFSTKVVTDHELVPPTSLNIARLLKTSVGPCNNTKPIIRGLDDLHESRHVQLKSVSHICSKLEDLQRVVTAFVDYVWIDLKLKDNITSFSKVQSGGSYFVGIAEKRHDLEDGYRTTTSDVVGFRVNDPENIIKHIHRKAQTNLLLLGNDGKFQEFPTDLIKCAFHKVEGTSPQRFVLEVSVGFINGIVFNCKDGPRSYCVREDRVVRLDKDDWLKKFKESYIRDYIFE